MDMKGTRLVDVMYMQTLSTARNGLRTNITAINKPGRKANNKYTNPTKTALLHDPSISTYRILYPTFQDLIS